MLRIFRSEFFTVSLIILFNIFLRLFRLNSPPIPYLDEKSFFLPAIRQSLQGIPDFTNEQPQLGKMIIAQSIKIFGDNPWGWRIPTAIFGTLIVLATYLLAKKVFNSKSIATLSALLLTFEISLFIQSRIVMMEVFYATFVLSAFIFVWSYLKNLKAQNLIMASIFFGLAAQVKWATAIPLGLAIIFIFFTQANLIKKIYLAFGVFAITILVYILFYLPFIAANGLSKWINLHQNVWYYHTILLPQNFEKYAPDYIPHFSEVELYTRSRISWLTNPQAIYFEQKIPQNKISMVLFYFNPIVFWGGLIALIATTIKKIKDERILFINSVFLTSYLSLFVIKGPVFPHYLLFGIPSLAIILSYFIVESLKLSKRMIFFIIVLTIIIFCLYYPLLTALPVPQWYFHLLTRY